MKHALLTAIVIWLCCLAVGAARAATVVFFDPSQVATPVSSGVTSDTISSNGYIFTYTRDKLFTGGTGHIIGRQERVHWPQGIEAQAVTTPPPGVTDYKARFTIERVDGDVFDFTSFTAMLLANTAGAGGAIELMPLVDGEDAFSDPLYFDASGYYGSHFSYDESPNPWGSTALLKDFATYKVALYVDFAFTALTFEGAVVPAQPGDYNNDLAVDAADYTVWRDHLGEANEENIHNAGDGLHGIDEADYGMWKRFYGVSYAVGAGAGGISVDEVVSAIPEPAAMAMFLLGIAILSAHRCRYNRLPDARVSARRLNVR